MNELVKERSRKARRRPVSPARAPIITAVITALTTVTVSIVGIFPQMGRGQDEKIAELLNDKKNLEAKLQAFTPIPKITHAISGTVLNGRQKPISNAAIYLLDDGVMTDDNGQFRISEKQLKHYKVLVINSEGTSTSILTIQPDLRAAGSSRIPLNIAYAFDKEQ